MGLDRVTREQLMNGNWHASVKCQLFDESDFHLISYNEYMKIPIVRVIRYWDLAATEVLNDDKLKCSDPDFTAGVLLAKDLNGNIYKHVTSQMYSILNSTGAQVKTSDY